MTSDGEIYSRLSFDSDEQRAEFTAAIKAAYIDGYEWGNIDDFPAGIEQAEKRWAGSDSNPENGKKPVRCEHCGAPRWAATTHCAPPFKVQPHLFSGNHPADKEKSHEH